jgi:hypothetical protein
MAWCFINLAQGQLYFTFTPPSKLYRVSQEEMSIFWEVIVLVILSKKVYIYTCPIPNDF